jgi:hypothetical protein
LLGDLIDLRLLDVEFNNFSGELPAEMANLENLRQFYLSNNVFEGAMVEGICLNGFITNVYADCVVECAIRAAPLAARRKSCHVFTKDNEIS